MEKLKRNKLKNFKPVKFNDEYFNVMNVHDSDSSLGNHIHLNRKKLFLRRFSNDDLFRIMKKTGLTDHLSLMGLDKLKLSIDVDESLINYFKLYNKDESPENLLMDLRLSESRFLPDMKFFDDKSDTVMYDMIVIEWLSAQNPGTKFSSSKPQLPGQTKPGLGALSFCFKMMSIVAKEIFKDGFLDIPDHMHGSIMYSKNFKFFDPVHEAILQAILRDLKEYSLSDISWGMITETIIDIYNNKPQKFAPAEQIFYISKKMKNYFYSKKYKSTFKNYYKKKKYRFEFEKMIEKRKKLLDSNNIVDL